MDAVVLYLQMTSKFPSWTHRGSSPLSRFISNYLQATSNRSARENGVTTGFALHNCIITNDAASTATLAFTVEENAAAGTLKTRTNVA
jgi:hypothetical protein